jgi:hypothetical protein
MRTQLNEWQTRAETERDSNNWSGAPFIPRTACGLPPFYWPGRRIWDYAMNGRVRKEWIQQIERFAELGSGGTRGPRTAQTLRVALLESEGGWIKGTRGNPKITTTQPSPNLHTNRNCLLDQAKASQREIDSPAQRERGFLYAAKFN